MVESTQQKLTRVRKPRVHITYDVEIGDAEVKRELPFVVGVLGDFSADSEVEKKSLRERKFTQIDPDNFTAFMAGLEPAVSFRVKNVLADDDSELPIALKFKSMDDFHPAQVAEQVEPLRKLLEVRNRLRELLTRVDRSEELEAILSSCLSDEGELKALTNELSDAGSGAGDDGAASADDAPQSEGSEEGKGE